MILESKRFSFQNSKPMKRIAGEEIFVFVPKRIYNPVTAMGFSAMFTFQLDNTKVNIAGTPLP